MNGIKLGYDQLDNGKKIYLKFPLNFYGKFISKITQQNIPGQKSVLKFYKLSSSSGNKYAFKFHNFFYFKLNEDSLSKKRNNKMQNNNNKDNELKDDKIYKFNFELSKKSKIVNSLNFDMNPLIKITMNNFLKLKYGNYFGSHNQPLLFNNLINNNNKNTNKSPYDFSSIFPSMIPYKRIGISLNKSFSNENNIHNLKLSFNKIIEYESNIKLSNILKSSYIFNFFNCFNILFSNEFIVKKSFVFQKKVKYNHIFSNYHIKSKIVDMQMEQKNNEINNGNNFYIQNLTFLRFFDLPILKYFEVTNKIMPYFSLESFFIPRKSSNYKDFFKLIYNLGVSFQIKDNLFVDFSFLTGATKNISIKKKHINSFRIKLST
jgi:hypothetical protein